MTAVAKRNWKTTLLGFGSIVFAIAQHIILSSPISPDAIALGLGLIVAGDGQ